jgi:GntR family transcriptional regulator
MESSRKKSAGSFPFEADESSDTPLWMQLRRRLVYLIETGYFSPGDKLPTVRGLASDININYNTVNKAYLSLAADGYIESTRGRGAFVCELPTQGDDDLAHEVDVLVDDFISACCEVGLGYDEIQGCVSRRIEKLKRDKAAKVASNVVSLQKEAGKSKQGAGA